MAYEATYAEAERIEYEGGPGEPEAARRVFEADAEVERLEAAGGPAVAEESSPGARDELGLPERRQRRPRRPGGSRDRRPGGSSAVLLLAAAGAVVTVVLTIVFTRLSGMDYGHFAFWLVVFTLAAHLNLRLRGGGVLSLGLAPLLGALVALPVDLPTVTYDKIAAAGVAQVIWVFLFGTLIVMLTSMFGELKREEMTGLLLDLTGVGAAVLVFFLAMQILPQKPELLGHYTPAMLFSAALAAGVMFLVFLGKSSYIQAQQEHFSPGLYLQSVLRKSWYPYLMLGFTGVLMGMVAVGIGMWSALFVLPLLPVFMYAYNRIAATDRDLLETIRVLAAIPEETGMLARGHANRVAQLSSAVARELGLSPEDVKQVEYASYLHDIGAISRGGGRQPELAESEGVITKGVDILGRVDYLEVAAEILHGREGLRDRVGDVDKRRAVSIGAGIVTAVDDFESLLMGEGDREPLSEHEALTEMNLERGVRYDSKVLRAIARVYPRLPKEGITPVGGGSAEESEFWSEQ